MRSHLTYANVMATVAVFLALGGTSYAVTKGSIGSREIANNALRSADIRDESIRSRDVDDGSLKTKDFAAGQLPAGERGPQGEPGAPGKDATKLFAAIRDNGGGNTAEIVYGSGVTAVTDPAGHNMYTVTFDRSVAGCVVQAVSGFGDPAGGGSAAWAIPVVTVYSGGANDAAITFHDHTNTVTDTAFLVTAFC